MSATGLIKHGHPWLPMVVVHGYLTISFVWVMSFLQTSSIFINWINTSACVWLIFVFSLFQEIAVNFKQTITSGSALFAYVLVIWAARLSSCLLISSKQVTLKCLSIGTHKIINFPFVSNGKFMVFMRPNIHA